MKLFFFFSILHDLYGRVAGQMRAVRPQLACSGLVYGPDQVGALRKLGFPVDAVTSFTSVLTAPTATRSDPSMLRAWEARHGIPLMYLMAADRLYWRMDRDDTLRVAAAAIRCVTESLERTRPDAVVAEGIDCLLSYVLYYEARTRGIPFLITYASPLPGRFAIYSNHINRWEEVDSSYAALRRAVLTDAQIRRADAMIDGYTRNKTVPTYMGAYRRMFYPRRDIATLVRVIRRLRSDPAHQYNPSYHGGVGSIIGARLKRVVRANIANHRFFNQPAAGERFVFFPLQLQPEASTLVLAPFFTNQVYAVECLAKSLPIDHVLYVKEHPAMVGRRSLSEYRRLNALPNVRLISPAVHSHDLIRDASAVAVITSTVGWEAAVYRKPVVVLGNVWYDGFDIVRKVQSVSELPVVLRGAIEAPPADLMALRAAVLATLEGTYPGEIDNPAFNPGVVEDANVRAIADALIRRLIRVEHGSDPSDRYATVEMR